MLLPALAVNENGPLMPRAWVLTAGNFWRLLLVVVATAGPVAILSLIIQAALQGPDALIPDVNASTAMAAAQFHAMAMNMPYTSGISFLVAPLLLGLLLGAGVSIYKTLQGTQESA